MSFCLRYLVAFLCLVIVINNACFSNPDEEEFQFFTQLAMELQLQIVSHLEDKELSGFSLTSKECYGLAQDSAIDRLRQQGARIDLASSFAKDIKNWVNLLATKHKLKEYFILSATSNNLSAPDPKRLYQLINHTFSGENLYIANTFSAFYRIHFSKSSKFTKHLLEIALRNAMKIKTQFTYMVKNHMIFLETFDYKFQKQDFFHNAKIDYIKTLLKKLENQNIILGYGNDLINNIHYYQNNPELYERTCDTFYQLHKSFQPSQVSMFIHILEHDQSQTKSISSKYLELILKNNDTLPLLVQPVTHQITIQITNTSNYYEILDYYQRQLLKKEESLVKETPNQHYPLSKIWYALYRWIVYYNKEFSHKDSHMQEVIRDITLNRLDHYHLDLFFSEEMRRDTSNGISFLNHTFIETLFNECLSLRPSRILDSIKVWNIYSGFGKYGSQDLETRKKILLDSFVNNHDYQSIVPLILSEIIYNTTIPVHEKYKHKLTPLFPFYHFILYILGMDPHLKID